MAHSYGSDRLLDDVRNHQKLVINVFFYVKTQEISTQKFTLIRENCKKAVLDAILYSLAFVSIEILTSY